MSEMAVSTRVEKYLTGLARRLEENPDFMAYVLTVYKAQERLQDDALVERLKISPKILARLALCKRPTAESAEFANQVRQIAVYTDMEPAILANVIRQVDSLESLAGRSEALSLGKPSTRQLHSHTGLLAATRDRCEIEGEEPDFSSEDDSSSDD